jgi:hypothetical protein
MNIEERKEPGIPVASTLRRLKQDGHLSQKV